MQNWIIGISGSDLNDVIVERVIGTTEQVKNYLVEQVMSDKNNDNENWDFGTESPSEVSERNDGTLYAFGAYCSYHNDYTATLEIEPKVLD